MAVGSSKISISLSRNSIFKISTLCCIPTVISLTMASGSIFKLYCFDKIIICLRAFSLTKKPFLHSSVPKIILSNTLKVSTNLKC